MSPKEIFALHHFLHSKNAGDEYHFSTNEPHNKLHRVEIMKTATQYRYLTHEGITFVEQTKKNTFYGCLAKEGRKITWGYSGHSKKPVIRLVDSQLTVKGKRWTGEPIDLKS